MGSPDLETIPVAGLDVVSNRRDLRRDLHTFVRYVREREIKRAHRDNALPKSDALRLAALASDVEARTQIEKTGSSAWIDFVDRLALLLGFVRYETKGVYQGESSSHESFPDNFIELEEKRYEKFLRKPLEEQEDAVLAALIDGDDKGDNELFLAGPLGRLDQFDSFGCATGVLPTLSFPQTRRQLLKLLTPFQPGVWYSTASLVELLKRKDPYFLIPDVLPKDAVRYCKDRYQNFHERKDEHSYTRETVTEKTPNAFERVEGRYLERFLEGIPLTMGYMDVAYRKGGRGGRCPSLGELRAFRLTEIFRLALRKQIPAPRVVVLPNFEVHVDAPVYPASEVTALLPLCETVADGSHAVLKLERRKVAEAAVADGPIDAVGLLKSLAAGAVPANVLVELEGWMGRSDTFTLYDGFGLLEWPGDPGPADLDPAVRFLVERVSSGVAVVRSPAEVFRELEDAERVPIKVDHPDAFLRMVAAGSSSLFVEKVEKRGTKSPPRKERGAVLKRTVRFSLQFPDAEMLDTFRKAALDLKCVLSTNRESLSVAYSKKEEGVVRAVLESLKARYDFRIEDEGA